jgi:antitoxin component of RelBE/YafQ-DinJ toxin-antitoxin module
MAKKKNEEAAAVEGAEAVAAGSTENVPEEAEAAVEAPVGVTDTDAIIEFLDKEISDINALPKKSNYHNARRSAYKTVRDLISPPPPKPPKVKKSKAKSAAAGAGEAGGEAVTTTDGTEAGSAVVTNPEANAGDTGAA